MKVPGDAQRVGCMERRASEILRNRLAWGGVASPASAMLARQRHIPKTTTGSRI